MALFLTPQEVASRWNCSARHVTRLCAGGELPAMRLRRGVSPWRISVSAVEAYEASNSTTPKVAAKPASVVVSPVTVTFTPGDWELPDGYVPRFPNLWGMSPDEAKARR